jgi:hypothetical protein
MTDVKNRRVVVAFDIEGRGMSMMRNGLNAIGWCVMDCETLERLEKGYVCVQPLPGQEFEKRCLEEFWHAKPEHRVILDRIESESIPAKDAIDIVKTNIVRWQNTYAIAFIASDNVAFDIAFLNYYFDYFGYPPLLYHQTESGAAGGYKTVHDTYSYAAGVMGWKHSDPSQRGSKADRICKAFDLSIKAEHNHMPDNDAEYIAEMYLNVQQHATPPTPGNATLTKLRKLICIAGQLLLEEEEEAARAEKEQTQAQMED